MRPALKIIFPTAILLFAALLLMPAPLPAAEVTIVGEVTDSSQILADDIVFEVDGTPEGDNLVTNFVGKRVEVTGKLTIDGDMRIIAVKSFKVVED